MSEQQSPQEQLRQWYHTQGSTKERGKVVKAAGIPMATWQDYVSGTINLENITADRKRLLYQMTGLECFRQKGQSIETSQATSETSSSNQQLSEVAKYGKQQIDKVVLAATSQLSGIQKLEAGLLQAQQYQPSAQQRTDAIMELLDILASEVDYFRTANDSEKTVLVDTLQQDPQSFGYITQMLNIIYQGKNLDNWMLMAQPPAKIKNIMRK